MTKADFLFHIITTSGVPVYRQLLDQINTLISTGRLQAGDFLPSIRETGKALEINPMTVSKAYFILEREGVLKNCKGQGMQIIAGPRPMKSQKERKKIMQPYLQQVVSHARQMALTQTEIMEMLGTLWEEETDE